MAPRSKTLGTGVRNSPLSSVVVLEQDSNAARPSNGALWGSVVSGLLLANGGRAHMRKARGTSGPAADGSCSFFPTHPLELLAGRLQSTYSKAWHEVAELRHVQMALAIMHAGQKAARRAWRAWKRAASLGQRANRIRRDSGRCLAQQDMIYCVRVWRQRVQWSNVPLQALVQSMSGCSPDAPIQRVFALCMREMVRNATLRTVCAAPARLSDRPHWR